MALLYYQTLEDSNPQALMRSVLFGLKDFYEFQQNTRKYLESDASVKRLGWKPDKTDLTKKKPGPNDQNEHDGVWIQLVEPKGRPNESEMTFKTFMDENNRSLYQTETSANRDDSNKVVYFFPDREIVIIDQDPENYRIKLEKRPKESMELVLRPNTYSLNRQIKALQHLQNAPFIEHKPLIRLFQNKQHATWADFSISKIDETDWMLLTDPDRPGSDEQRRFVEIAMATPDFAFLDGPPGSGKTTAISELILQFAKKGLRVLLVASTHVAVDNVLERVMAKNNSHSDWVVPVRIGDRRNISEEAKPFQLETFLQTEKKRLLRFLESFKKKNRSQKELHRIIQKDKNTIEKMVLASANLVCGTTIGILQYPDIKKEKRPTPQFDVMIIDEASKTTFQEFLVPALLAKKWIVVGDPRQLSPYVEDEFVATNLEAAFPEQAAREACLDCFDVTRANPRHKKVIAVEADDTAKEFYISQSSNKNASLLDLDNTSEDLSYAELIVGSAESLSHNAGKLPLDLSIVRGNSKELHTIKRRVAGWNSLTGNKTDDSRTWESELSWRLASAYEQRFSPDTYTGKHKSTRQRIEQEIEILIPCGSLEKRLASGKRNGKSIFEKIEQVRRVALPSILESLRYGIERNDRQRRGNAVTDGMPQNVLDKRLVQLSFQHRSHPDITRFSREYLYDGDALKDPANMPEQRKWGYERYGSRAVWIDVDKGFNSRLRSNPEEAKVIVEELKAFHKWCKIERRPGGAPWEVAILTFYRGQEKEIRRHLRVLTKQRQNFTRFVLGNSKNPDLKIQLCTVDRFQGHEADVVFISFASSYSTSFLDSPNRLNVAITRARYQRVIVGNRKKMKRSKGSFLRNFAETEIWEQKI